MDLIPALTHNELESFYNLDKIVYEEYPLYRSTGSEIIHSLVTGKSLFCRHAEITPFLIIEADRSVGRFVLIHDYNLSDYAQVAFFEALPGITDLVEKIILKAQEYHPSCRKLVIGLNGHLNYGAGILLNRFNESPVYELPFNPEYYPNYFTTLDKKTIVTFRFQMKEFYQWGNEVRKVADLRGITVRNLKMDQYQKDIGIYTILNNACFIDHPYWSNRMVEEDLELFGPPGSFLKEENLLFAEYQGEPVGFLFWLPDLNELVGKVKTSNLRKKRHEIPEQFYSYRFSEIAVLPKFRGIATLALILEMLIPVQKLGCQYGEGGFIFEENKQSVRMTKRYYKRIFGRDIDPFRYMAVYECEI